MERGPRTKSPKHGETSCGETRIADSVPAQKSAIAAAAALEAHVVA
jgi:hypothetical protein